MQFNAKEKIKEINQVRVKYFTRQNKPLSLVMLLVISILLTIMQPIIGLLILVAYGVLLKLAIKRGLPNTASIRGAKIINNIDYRNHEDK